MIREIGLFLRDHPAGKREVKRPGHADQGVEQPAVGLHVEKQTERSIDADDDQAVEREKIRRERDPEIVPVGDDVAAFAAHPEPLTRPPMSQTQSAWVSSWPNT